MKIDDALVAQGKLIELLNSFGQLTTQVSEFLDEAVSLEEIYGAESDVTLALMKASNMTPPIDLTIGRLRVLTEQRTGELLIASRGKR